MTRHHLKLVPTRPRPPPALPEVLLVQRLNDVRDAWFALLWTWWLPQAWFVLCAALERYEGQRLRTLRG